MQRWACQPREHEVALLLSIRARLPGVTGVPGVPSATLQPTKGSVVCMSCWRDGREDGGKGVNVAPVAHCSGHGMLVCPPVGGARQRSSWKT